MGTEDYWLDRKRIAVIARLWVAGYALWLIGWVIVRVWLSATPVTTLRNDFAGFWSVGHMVLQGRAGEAYRPELALAAEAELVPQYAVNLPWFYPPPTFALVAPLAALPFLPAFFLWTAGGLLALAWSVRALAPNTPAVWLLLASPGLAWLLRFGQTGVLAAALFGGAIYLVAHGRPVAAGDPDRAPHLQAASGPSRAVRPRRRQGLASLRRGGPDDSRPRRSQRARLR